MRMGLPTSLVALFVAAVFWVSTSQTAVAQSASNIDANAKPPVSGAEFRKQAQTRFQRTDVQVLGPNDDLTLTTNANKPISERVQINKKTGQSIATILLIVIAIAALFWFINSRMGGALFRRNPDDGSLGLEAENSVAGLSVQASDDFAIDQLNSVSDPREGLRLLLVNALVRAARQNQVSLRRSLTTRDVVARIPKSWRHRNILNDLVRTAEPILFGARPFDRQQLEEATENARPMFQTSLFGSST